MSQANQIASVRQAAAVCNVTPPVVRRWLFLGLITEPPWTLQQLHQVRDETDPQGRRRGPQVAHGTMTRWNEGCSCTRCHEAQNIRLARRSAVNDWAARGGVTERLRRARCSRQCRGHQDQHDRRPG
jgi:hypothetical protein